MSPDKPDSRTLKVVAGDDIALTILMAPMSLNLVVGPDREALLAYGRAVWQASRQQALKYAATQCRQLADCEENTDEYRNGAAWCAEKIRNLK